MPKAKTISDSINDFVTAHPKYTREQVLNGGKPRREWYAWLELNEPLVPSDPVMAARIVAEAWKLIRGNEPVGE